eukprot:2633476-Amphidinium_carterae.1
MGLVGANGNDWYTETLDGSLLFAQLWLPHQLAILQLFGRTLGRFLFRAQLSACRLAETTPSWTN